MTECVSFELKVYKGDASGNLIEAGDTVTVILKNDDGTEEAQDLTVTGVHKGGRTICWNRETAGQDFKSSDVVRVGAEHQWSCPAEEDAELGWTHGAIDDVETVNSVTVDGTTVTLDTPIAIPITDPALQAAAEQQLQAAFIEAGGNGTLYVSDWTAAGFKVYLTNTTLTTGQLVITGVETDVGESAITMTFSVAL